MMLNTPVAFLIFNRPDLTELVFETIRQAKPKKLLVVADGPRFLEEVNKCQEARAVIKRVDWDCEVLTNFSEKNLGCGLRVSSGLDWVFSEVEEAIILEDDCLPASSFFYFCQTLLEYYQHDERIMLISGDNFQDGHSRTDYSYYFSKYNDMWGWASWRRAWKYYDFAMKTWPEYKKFNLIQTVCDNPDEQKFWTDLFDSVYAGNIDTWDYQWTYACFAQQGLAVIPNSNLVSNLGYRLDATHTKVEHNHLARLPKSDIWEIKHPPYVERNQEADAYAFEHVFQEKPRKNSKSIGLIVRQKLHSISKKIKFL
ncbi:MAG TPA: hemolytic protein HlpA-like protein [Cyanobacteria bacterium UBA8553]|nr:hemolytic protein HlpA-like protein [Cyanobacteria bacterium UBA8553]HAJ60078.1 hemolytic protein HlpA-like protein [Cyanobacteria bacterium UBA8543]